MADDDVAVRVRGAFGAVMGAAAADVTALRMGAHPAWDSLAHMDLVLALEQACGVTFAGHEIAALDSFDAVVAAVRRKRQQREGATDRTIEERVLVDRSAPPPRHTTDPHPALVAGGDAFVFGRGRVGLGPLPSVLLELCGADLRAVARTLGARPHRFPTLIGADTLARTRYLQSFPHALTVAAHLREDRAAIESFARSAHVEAGELVAADQTVARPSALLSPAVCYHAYQALAGRSLAEPYRVFAEGKCFRWESGALEGLRRLWDFSMTECVAVGTAEEVVAFRQRGMDALVAVLDAWGLAYRIHTASDPFFTADFTPQKVYQAAFELKFEASALLPYCEAQLAVASFNYHQDFFGRTFDIKGGDGQPAHTGCIGVGLERFALAFLAQHGTEPDHWPAAVRARYRDAAW